MTLNSTQHNNLPEAVGFNYPMAATIVITPSLSDFPSPAIFGCAGSFVVVYDDDDCDEAEGRDDGRMITLMQRLYCG